MSQYLRITTVALLGVVLAPSSSANTLSECRTLDSALERLDCYDNLPLTAELDLAEQESLSEPEPQAETLSEFATWERKAERDPISDRQNISFFAEPNEPQFNQFGTEKQVFLQLRCFDNTTAVVVYFDEFQIDDQVRVAIRLDDNPPDEVTWTVASNRQAIGLWNGRSAIPFVQSLKDVNRITMRVFLKDGAETYQFESDNINTYATELSKACDWIF